MILDEEIMKHKQRGDGVTIYAKNYSALSKDGDNTMELVEAMLALENGDILNIDGDDAFVEKSVVDADAILVDGLGVGDVGNILIFQITAVERNIAFFFLTAKRILL